MSGYANQITTLLLDASFLPYSFLTGRAAFIHLIKNNIKCFDASDNLIDNNFEWFRNENIHFYEDQPFLTSKDKIWFIPTVAVVRTSFFYNRRKTPRTLNIHKLCMIFDYTCQICFERFNKSELTIEHLFPKSQGGTKGIENITLTCKKCNQIKKDIYPFLNVKNERISSVPMPIPVLPTKAAKIRDEWRKYFLYKKL